MAFWSGLEHFEVQKTLQRGSYYTPKKQKNIILGAPIIHTPFTGVACWKLKGLARLATFMTLQPSKSVVCPHTPYCSLAA
jgi:hypothetical protein